MKKRLTLILLTGVAVVGTLLAGCTNNNENTEPTQPSTATATETAEEAPSQVTIQMDQTTLPVVTWKMDNSQLLPVKGKVLSDGKPVSGVVVGIAGKRNMTTDENGLFEVLVDRSIPQSIPLQVSNAEQATVEGKAVGSSTKEALKSASGRIDVYYPIQVTEVKADPDKADQVEVHARAVVEEGFTYPKTTLDKYVIQGVVKDAQGKPVKGAMVSFTRDKGEGWSRSEPANEKGEYRLYYFPEDDEDLYLNVHVGDVQYTLPEGRVYRFPEGTSVNTDIILPETGTTIVDQPPTLVSKPAKGALYWAQAIGLSIDPSVAYTISLPQEDGSFVLKIAKAEWDKSPLFYQTAMSRFSDTEIKVGDSVPSSWIPAPSKSDPVGIAPLN
ncbi:hypothetical protein D7Z26_10880 [Cohnella endophytica]|uniref:Carboxypeptidase regulatory-like domain-containing protein n=1 Tax=Cohnella endophytica TaxID=2419778 RepID=A0A494XTC0_9BACL|nr:carboxypeptidase-like regulatory domain-containing protein [Cohnella endophytica]RKP53893.1 hypothetical protein D7Z26_10880 [Cohnella endophytica]